MSKKLPLLILFSLFSFFTITSPSMGQPVSTKTEALAQHVANLETAMNHFKIDGSLNIDSEMYLGKMPGYLNNHPQIFPTTSLVGLRQSFNLNLNFVANPTLDFFVSLRQAGSWGSGLSSDGNYNVPGTNNLPSIEQAYFRYFNPRFLLMMGRQYFSLGPCGLIINNRLFPLDSLIWETSFAKLNFTGIFSRLSSEYYEGTPYVINSDNYTAISMAIPLPNQVFSYNILVNGLSEESAHSIGWYLELKQKSLAIETAIYRPSPTFFDADNKWHTASILTFHTFLPKYQSFLEFSAAFLDKGFTPTFCSAAFSAGNSGNRFYNNTLGFDLAYLFPLPSNAYLKAELVHSYFVDKDYAKEKNQENSISTHQLIISLTKSFSPNFKAELTYLRAIQQLYNYHQLFGGVTINF